MSEKDFRRIFAAANQAMFGSGAKAANAMKRLVKLLGYSYEAGGSHYKVRDHQKKFITIFSITPKNGNPGAVKAVLERANLTLSKGAK